MTDFLYLNELSVPVAFAQASQANQEHGAYFGRSLDGTGRRTSRAQKRMWSVATPPLDLADADALEGLVLGKGHHWPFDSHFYSSKGLGPDSGYSAGTVIGTTTPSPAVGAGYLEVPSAGSIAFVDARENETKLSHAELFERAPRAAGGLAARGIRSGDLLSESQ